MVVLSLVVVVVGIEEEEGKRLSSPAKDDFGRRLISSKMEASFFPLVRVEERSYNISFSQLFLRAYSQNRESLGTEIKRAAIHRLEQFKSTNFIAAVTCALKFTCVSIGREPQIEYIHFLDWKFH